MSNTAPEDELLEIIQKNANKEGPLLPILHDLQEKYGLIPENALPLIVDRLNISKAEVHGVISFYHDFKTSPSGRHSIKICRAEACQAVGANEMSAALLKKLGLDWHETSKDGAFTIEPVYCLGLCACGPAMMVDHKVIGRLDVAKMETLIKELKA